MTNIVTFLVCLQWFLSITVDVVTEVHETPCAAAREARSGSSAVLHRIKVVGVFGLRHLSNGMLCVL